MNAGFGMLETGFCRQKNAVNILSKNLIVYALASLAFWAIGFGIMFGSGNPLFGTEYFFLSGLAVDDVETFGTLTPPVFFFFQAAFAATAATIVSGAVAERVKFIDFIIFSILLTAVAYPITGHWVWGGGWAAELGVMDFAGGIVVHETAGLAALVIAFMLGARRDKNKPPHNPGYVMIGACMLWVGWFGFNAGSQLAADGGAAMALTVTHISAATASLTWALWEKIRHGKASMVGLVTGTIAGLASITPASGWVSPVEALIIGGVAGVLCQEACSLVKGALGIDDTLDVFAVHGVGGIFGTIMIAVFGYGGFGPQLIALAVVAVFTVVVTFVLVKVSSIVFPLRVNEDDETTGLDLSYHGERAYDHAS